MSMNLTTEHLSVLSQQVELGYVADFLSRSGQKPRLKSDCVEVTLPVYSRSGRLQGHRLYRLKSMRDAESFVFQRLAS